MYKFISSFLEKLGNWFGIIFKIALPLLFMYRPIKTFVFSFVVIGFASGADSYVSSDFGVIAFSIVYAVLALLLFFFPRAASVFEFFLIAWYFAFLIATYAGALDKVFPDAEHILKTYSKEIIPVLLFLAAKIFFFFFIMAHDEEYEKKQKRGEQLITRG